MVGKLSHYLKRRRCLKFICPEKLFRSALVWNSLSFVNSTYKFHTVTGKWSENFRLSPYELVTIWKKIIHLSKSLMSPSEHVTIWKKYSFSYQYEYVTIWYVTIWIIFISVTILVWKFQMVTDMNPSYQASIRWHLSPYGG